MITKYDKDNRTLFNKIHQSQNTDKSIRNKIINIMNTKDLKLNKNFFQDKVCADFGCGSNSFGALNMTILENY